MVECPTLGVPEVGVDDAAVLRRILWGFVPTGPREVVWAGDRQALERAQSSDLERGNVEATNPKGKVDPLCGKVAEGITQPEVDGAPE